MADTTAEHVEQVYVAPKGRRILTAAQTAELLRSLSPRQRAFLATPGQRLA